jgi:hypothetical protein
LALPFGLSAPTAAAPAVAGTGNAVSTIDTKAPVVQVGGRGHGGYGGFKAGGFASGGVHAFRGGGGGYAFRSAGIGSFNRNAYRARAYSGPRLAYRNHGNFYGRHHGRHFRYFAAYPYYYSSYYPDYYYDDTYYDDGGYYDGGYAAGGDAYAQCAARYQSFDPASGTFLGYDGERHPCPYL